jgi:hypothetical protein
MPAVGDSVTALKLQAVIDDKKARLRLGFFLPEQPG